jgi:hypothetical protein
MRTTRKHHRRHRTSHGGSLLVDDGQVNGNDECRASFTAEDGTVIGVTDGREVFKSKMHGGLKIALACLAVTVALILGIPISIGIVKLTLMVLQP